MFFILNANTSLTIDAAGPKPQCKRNDTHGLMRNSAGLFTLDDGIDLIEPSKIQKLCDRYRRFVVRRSYLCLPCQLPAFLNRRISPLEQVPQMGIFAGALCDFVVPLSDSCLNSGLLPGQLPALLDRCRPPLVDVGGQIHQVDAALSFLTPFNTNDG